MGSYKTQQYSCLSLQKRKIYSWLWCLSGSVKISKKQKSKMSHYQHSTVHPHTVCVHTQFSTRALEEAKGRFLLVPLGHLLTLSLDLSEFGLCGDLCDAFHCDPFKKYSTLGEKRSQIEGWTWFEFKDTPSHTYKRNILTVASFLYESLCAETTDRNILNPALPFDPSAFKSMLTLIIFNSDEVRMILAHSPHLLVLLISLNIRSYDVQQFLTIWEVLLNIGLGEMDQIVIMV